MRYRNIWRFYARKGKMHTTRWKDLMFFTPRVAPAPNYDIPGVLQRAPGPLTVSNNKLFNEIKLNHTNESGPRSQTWTGDTLVSAETFGFFQLQPGALPTELSEAMSATSLVYINTSEWNGIENRVAKWARDWGSRASRLIVKWTALFFSEA